MTLLGRDKTEKAAEYPPELCREILRGVQDQLQLEAQKWKGFIGHVGISQQPVYDLDKEEVDEVKPEHEEESLQDWDGALGHGPTDPMEEESEDEHRDIRDSLTGDILPRKMVADARREEIEFMEDWRVGDMVPVRTARTQTGKGPLRGKWVDSTRSSDPVMWRAR